MDSQSPKITVNEKEVILGTFVLAAACNAQRKCKMCFNMVSWTIIQYQFIGPFDGKSLVHLAGIDKNTDVTVTVTVHYIIVLSMPWLLTIIVCYQY